MPIPSSKKELSDTLTLEFDRLMDELISIPKNLTRKKELEGNISVSDCIAYQIGWGLLLVNWYECGKKNTMPDLPSKDYKWNQLGDLAKHFYKTYESESFDSLLKKFRQTVEKIKKIIHENTNTQLYTIGVYNWTGDKWPLGRYINVNTSSPYKSARSKIRKWKKTNSLN